MEFRLSQSDVERLLSDFATGALSLDLRAPLLDVDKLPSDCRKFAKTAQESGRPWAAWSTPCGPILVWGEYDLEGSKQLNAHLLFIQWWDEHHHALWCYCDPKRSKDWVVGRG